MKRLIDVFHERAIERGAIPIFCVFPLEKDIRSYWEEGTEQYSPLLSHFRENGYRYIDALHAFDDLDRSFDTGSLYIHFYTVLGNRLVADYIGPRLAQLVDETAN
jgi:hypothetical protein